jgi:hypothetical protein
VRAQHALLGIPKYRKGLMKRVWLLAWCAFVSIADLGMVTVGFTSDRSGSSSASSVAATLTAPPLDKCCFCVAPNPGELDSDKLTAQCERCFGGDVRGVASKEGCTSVRTVSRAEFAQNSNPQKCRDVKVWYNDHGINSSKTQELVTACVSKSCGLNATMNITDLSCQTASYAKLPALLEQLKQDLGPGAIVQYEGFVSNGLTNGCVFRGITDTFIVSDCGFDRTVSDCQAPDELCSPIGGEYKCRSANGELVTQMCCGFSLQAGRCSDEDTQGTWSEPGRGCEGSSTCPQRCEFPILSCSDDVEVRSNCRYTCSGGRVCVTRRKHCSDFGKKCSDSRFGMASCVDPAPARSSNRSSSSASAGKDLEVAPQVRVPGQVYGSGFVVVSADQMVFSVPRGVFKELVSSARNIFGTTRADSISYARRFPGVLLSEVDAGSLLGAMLYKDGDVVYQVNGVNTATAKVLGDALKAASTTGSSSTIKISYARKDIFYAAYIQLVDSGAVATR